MKIALGCDHGGLNLMAEIAEYLKSQNIKFKDFGTYSEEANNDINDCKEYWKTL